MRLLLDTHAFLWFAEGSPKLSERARFAIQDAENERVISIASLWEMAIKIGIGRLSLSMSLQELVLQAQRESIELLPVSVGAVTRLTNLPFHHRDPFDRLLAAECLELDMDIISADAIFDSYGVRRIW